MSGRAVISFFATAMIMLLLLATSNSSSSTPRLTTEADAVAADNFDREFAASEAVTPTDALAAAKQQDDTPREVKSMFADTKQQRPEPEPETPTFAELHPETQRSLSSVEEGDGSPKQPRPCGGKRQRFCCGDGKCNGPENWQNCLADCPGVTTDAQCGEEPHSDTGGYDVVFGINHRATSAQDCCDRCRTHAANPKHQKKCNSWVFCPLPVCWGLDTGWNHTYGECWLKYQADPSHPLYGQRGQYTAEYRRKHARVRTGPPTHVPWTGGVIGGTVDLSVKWSTGIEGMRSSAGHELTNWRAWEPAGSYEKRLAKRKKGQIN